MRVGVVIPTVGASDRLDSVLTAVDRQSVPNEIVLVHQGPPSVETGEERIANCIEFERRIGFAAAVNRGLEALDTELVAVVNDDAIVGPDWLDRLASRLEADPSLAAVQGINLTTDGTTRVDGTGLAWNRWWQAVQLDRGRTLDELGLGNREVYGVSATAALYRRDALDAVATPDGPFEERLDTYYEDVELAGRLRAAGYRAASVSTATVDHLGGASAGTLGRRRLSLLYGNRILVVARLLGRSFWPRLPWVLGRDKLDAVTRPSRLRGILAGWSRALRHLPSFAHAGAPLLSLSALGRFRETG